MRDTGSKTSQRVILVVSVITAFFTPFMDSAIRIALPSIGKEFASDAIMIGWIATASLLASAMFLVPFGKIADIHGRRKIFTWGIIVYTVASFLCAISPSAIILIFFRMLQGLGNGMIYGVSYALLTSVYPIGERGKVLGIYVAAVFLGLSLGLPLGGFLTALFGWRSIFLISAFSGVIVIVAVLWKLRGEWAEARGEKFDLIGSIIYGLGLVALMYGLTALTTILGVWLIVTGIAGLLAFVWWELRVKNPVLNIRIFRHNAIFSFSNLVAMIHYCATSGSGFLLSLYLQYIKGFSPQNAGLIMIFMPAVQAILSPFVGRLSDWLEPRILVSAGMACTSAALFLFTFLNEKTALGLIIFGFILLGIGFALFASPNSNAIMSSIDKKYYGVASGIVQTMRVIGQLLGMALTLLIFTVFIGSVQITPEYYPPFLNSVQTAFAIFTFISFSAIFASFVGTRIR